MKTTDETIEQLANKEYEWGFVTDIESDSLPPGLDEDTVRWISAKKGEPEFLLEWQEEPWGERKRGEPHRDDRFELLLAPERDLADLEEGVGGDTGDQQRKPDRQRAFRKRNASRGRRGR